METQLFNLENSIKVHLNQNGKNTIVEVSELYLKAPSAYEDRTQILSLRQSFLKGLTKLANDFAGKGEATKDDSKELDNKTISAVINLGVENIANFYNDFIELGVKNIFKDQGSEQKINKAELNKLSQEDLDNLIATYLRLFFVNSWMKVLA
jgi:hypothetical protein